MSFKPETNEEFLVRIMNFGCPTGGLVQAYIIEALAQYSKEVVESTQEWDNGLVNHEAWKRTAQFVVSEIEKKYERKI